MSTHAIIGTLNGALVLSGIVLQLLKMRGRERAGLPPSEGIAFDYVCGSWASLLAVCAYGASLDVMNHYLVWPRVPCVLLTVWAMRVIYRYRRQRLWSRGFAWCGMISVTVVLLIIWRRGVLIDQRRLIQVAIYGAGAWIFRGLVTQNLAAQRARRTAALSRGLFALNLAKDFTNMLFGSTMGTWGAGLPLFLFGLALTAVKLWTVALFVIYGERGRADASAPMP